MSFKRTMTVIAVLAMMAVLFVPVVSDESSAEITTDGITVVVPTHDVTETKTGNTISLVIDNLKVNNNKTTSMSMYITNDSPNALNISTSGIFGNSLVQRFLILIDNRRRT